MKRSSSKSRPYKRLPARRLEREACVELNLTPGAYGREYSADIFGEITCRVLENGVSVASQGERALGVARDSKIRMVEQIVGLRSKRDLHAFPQLEFLLHGQIELREPGSAKDIPSRITKLTGRWQGKGTRTKPAGRTAYVTAVWTNTFVRVANK